MTCTRSCSGVIGVLLLSAFLGNTAAAQSGRGDAGAYPAGMTSRSFQDTTRLNWAGTGPRPLATTIWYPAVRTADEDTIYIGPPDRPFFMTGAAAQGAELSAASRKYPLVLLSHGTGGSAMQMMWLGRYLAAHGYIAAAVNHHGNTGAEEVPTPQGFVLWWERTRDLSAVLDKLLADPLWGPRIDTQRIGAAGFSLGGYTVISLAGGLTDFEAFEAFCKSGQHPATCEGPPEFPGLVEAFEQIRDDPRVQASLRHAHDSYRDERVKAVFAIAPALGGAFTDADLAPIDIPVSIVVGEADQIAPAATNARHFAEGIEGATLMVIPGVRHYTFLSECTAAGVEALPLLCEPRNGVDRAEVHRRVGEMAREFFDRTL